MILLNSSRKKVISKDLQIVDSFFQKGLGLLNPGNSRSLLMTTRLGIHTFGLRKPIDVVIVDDDYKVITMRKSLKPNRFFFWNPKYFTVIELPAGTLTATNTQIGDILFLN